METLLCPHGLFLLGDLMAEQDELARMVQNSERLRERHQAAVKEMVKIEVKWRCSSGLGMVGNHRWQWTQNQIQEVEEKLEEAQQLRETKELSLAV